MDRTREDAALHGDQVHARVGHGGAVEKCNQGHAPEKRFSYAAMESDHPGRSQEVFEENLAQDWSIAPRPSAPHVN
jgi:hypothetical protein